MKPISRLRRTNLSAAVHKPALVPWTKTDPSSGVRRHPSKDSNVVFPLPEGPMISVNVEEANFSETSVSARTHVLPDPKETLAFSTANECSSTEHLGRFNGDCRLHRKNGSETTHS